MIIRNVSDIEPFPTSVKGDVGRVMIGPKEGAPNFAMRVFEYDPGVTVERGSYDWEHQVMILSGKGLVLGAGGQEWEVEPMSCIFVAPQETFGLKNIGTDILRFVCIVPLSGNPYTEYK